MENDQLSQAWNSQKDMSSLTSPDQIIKKAKKQRNRQFIGIAVMSITVLVLLVYIIYSIINQWNDLMLGLILMISSLIFRVALEFVSLYRKESQLVALDNQSFKAYLKSYHSIRLKVNYIITPICFAVYIFGFVKLLPYFKQAFSESFYQYILISGFASLFVVALIFVNSKLKECHFFK